MTPEPPSTSFLVERDEEARAMLGLWFCSKNSCSLKCFLIKEGEQTAALKAFLFSEPSLG